MTVFAFVFMGTFGGFLSIPEVQQLLPLRLSFDSFLSTMLTEIQLLTMEKWTEPMLLAELRYAELAALFCFVVCVLCGDLSRVSIALTELFLTLLPRGRFGFMATVPFLVFVLLVPLTLMTLVVPAVLEAFTVPQSQSLALQQEEFNRFLAHFHGTDMHMSPSIELMGVSTAYGDSPTTSYRDQSFVVSPSTLRSGMQLFSQHGQELEQQLSPLSAETDTESREASPDIAPLSDSFELRPTALGAPDADNAAASAATAGSGVAATAAEVLLEDTASPSRRNSALNMSPIVSDGAGDGLPAAFALMPAHARALPTGLRPRMHSGMSGVSGVGPIVRAYVVLSGLFVC